MALSKYVEDDLNNNEEVKVPFPHKITRVDNEINKQLLEDFTGKIYYKHKYLLSIKYFVPVVIANLLAFYKRKKVIN